MIALESAWYAVASVMDKTREPFYSAWCFDVETCALHGWRCRLSVESELGDDKPPGEICLPTPQNSDTDWDVIEGGELLE